MRTLSGIIVVGLGFSAAPANAAPETPTAAHRAADAASDHGLLVSRAETLRAGEVALSLYQLLVPGLSAGLTDRLELSGLYLMWPEENPTFWALQAKYAFVRTENATVSARVNVSSLGDDDGCADCDANSLVRTARAELAADLRVGTGPGAAGLHGALGITRTGSNDSVSVHVDPGVGAIVEFAADVALSEHWSLLTEVRAPTNAVSADELPLDEPVAGVGVRLYGQHLALDAGVFVPLAATIEGAPSEPWRAPRVPFVPWFTLTGRFSVLPGGE
jgi:hypothetical protein